VWYGWFGFLCLVVVFVLVGNINCVGLCVELCRFVLWVACSPRGCLVFASCWIVYFFLILYGC